MSDARRIQDEVRDFWDDKPCGSDLSKRDPNTRDYYDEIEKERYQHQYHIPKILDWVQWGGKKALEIGTGVGTDARLIIERGGLYTGINVDVGSVMATEKSLKVFQLPGVVKQSSATDIFLEDESVDVVYSFGVLHHIPEVTKAVDEIYRVLKKDGELLIMLYNRNSINYKIEIKLLRKLLLRFLGFPGVVPLLARMGFPREKLQRHAELYRALGSLSDQEWLNRNTDGPDNPYSQVYSGPEAEALLKERFKIIKNEVFYFEPRHWGVFGRLLPKSFVGFLGRRWGWHRIIHAVKTE